MKNNIYKFWSLYLITILIGFIIYSQVIISQFSATHTNKLQGLLNSAVSELVLVNGDIYQENQQVTIPANLTLNVNGATIEPLSGLWRSSWDGNLHHEDFIIKLSDNSTIKNGTLDGLGKKGWAGITAYNVDNYTIRDMTIKSFRFTCFNGFNSRNVRISNNNFQESSIQPDNWESKYLYFNYFYNSEISYNNFSGLNGQRGQAGGGLGVKWNGNVYYWENVDVHHNDFNLFPLHGWINPATGNNGANYSFEINSNFNGKGLEFHHNTSNTGISFMRKNVTTDLNNDAHLYNNRFIMEKDATLCYEFENVHMTIENDYVTGARYVMGFFGKASAPNYTRDIIVRNCIFDTGANAPGTIFTNGAITTGLVSIENSTIYCGDKALVQLFANTGSIGNTLQNYKLHKNLFINKTSTNILISNAPKSGWDISDNKFEGNWNTQEWSDNVSVTGAVSGSGVKPFPFYETTFAGYGAEDIGGDIPPIDPPPDGDKFQFIDNFYELQEPQPWRLQLGSPQSVVRLDDSHSLTGPTSLYMRLDARTDYANARAQYDWVGHGGTGIPTKAPVFTTTGVKFAVYFPIDYKNDPNREILFQQHGAGSFSPPISIAVLNGTIYAWLYGNPVERGYDPNYSYLYDNLGTVTPGEWHYLVLNSYLDYRDYNNGGEGYTRIYLSISDPCSTSDIVVNHNNPNCYNQDFGLNPIINIYKWQWNDPVRAQNSIDLGVTKREWWFDEYVYQNYDIELDGGGPIDPPEPGPGLDTLIITGQDLDVIYK